MRSSASAGLFGTGSGFDFSAQGLRLRPCAVVWRGRHRHSAPRCAAVTGSDTTDQRNLFGIVLVGIRR